MAADGIFTRFAEPGRLACVRYGPLEGKTVVVCDIVDLARVIVSGPHSNVQRQMMPLKWLALTNFKCSLKRGAGEKSLKANMKKDDIVNKFAQTGWAKKQAARKVKANLTDLQRFKLMLAKKKMGHSARVAVQKKFRKNKK